MGRSRRLVAAPVLAAALAASCFGAIPGAEERSFALLPDHPAGSARLYVYHVGSGDGVAEDVWIGRRQVATLARGFVGVRPYCEYVARTVQAGTVRVAARLSGAFGGGVAPDAIALDVPARSGAQVFVRLRTESSSGTFGSPTNASAVPVISSGGHGLEVIESSTPPRDLARCYRPAGADAAQYDQLLLDRVLACLDAPPARDGDFAHGMCDCWSRHGAELLEPAAVTIRATAEGTVDSLRCEPDGPLAACLAGLVGSRVPEPPGGARDVTIRLQRP